MAVPQAPKNLFINQTPNYSVVRWDKVIQDIGSSPNYIPAYTKVTSYSVYKTDNPSMNNWVLLSTITSTDNFGDVDAFYIDFIPGNYIYKVCASNIVGMGPCASSFGILGNPQAIITTQPGLWDVSLWDASVWGP
jgi:hypothetical protein